MQTSDRAACTVIIPNYNGLDFLKKCMDSLYRQSCTSFFIVVVDNGSTDGSKEYLKGLSGSREIELPQKSSSSGKCEVSEVSKKSEKSTEFSESAGSEKSTESKESEVSYIQDADATPKVAHPLVFYILLQENTGFSNAVNMGISIAQTDYVVLLNNDTEAEPGYLRELLKPFKEEKGEKIAAVSPMMIQLYHPELLDDAGDGYNILGWAYQRGTGQNKTTRAFKKQRRIFSACGGAAAYKKSALEEVRFAPGIYFDPLHFAYLEDMDLSFRLRIHGYSIIYAPKAMVLHAGSGTQKAKYTPFKVRISARNNIYLNYKNMPLLMLIFNLPGIIAGTLIKYLFFLKKGFGKDYLEGLGEGLRGLKECRKHKTFFKPDRFFTYIKLELMLIFGIFEYIKDFLVRHFLTLVNFFINKFIS